MIFKLSKCIFLLLSSAALLLVNPIHTNADEHESLPIVIITVDVESTEGITLPEQKEAVCVDKTPCGLQEMVRLLKEKGYAATFFLNVYEYKKYGEPVLEDIAKSLRSSGQDIQLHTHPQWAYDQNRNMMYQYSLKEQINIIREGKELLQKWTGLPVIAHRAGAYSADENTLRALIENGIYYDSSLFWGWSNSRINSIDLKKNVLSLYGPLYEFPVTVYQRDEYPVLFNGKVQAISEIRKFDINWFINDEEAEKAFTQAISSKMDFVILFLHSFSFIKGRNEAGVMVADTAAVRRFENVLNLISKKGLKVYTFRQIGDDRDALSLYLNKADVIPEISVEIKTVPYFLKLIGINRNNYKMIILSFASFFFLSAVIWLLVRKKRREPA